MADGDYSMPTYPGVFALNADHRGREHHHHDKRGLEGKDAAFIEGLHDANRDLAAANASAGRDVDVMSAVRESNSLLQLRIDILSGGGTGPLAR